jgi:hypothetical protein
MFQQSATQLVSFGGFVQESKQCEPELRVLTVSQAGHYVSGWKRLQTKGASPHARTNFGAALTQGKLYVHGGSSEQYHGDVVVYNFDVGVWSKFRDETAAHGPGQLMSHTLSYHAGRLYSFGGVKGATGKSSSELWSIAVDKPENGWVKHADAPETRSDHSAVVWNNTLNIFCGTDGTKYCVDVLQYSMLENNWRVLHPAGRLCPPPRCWQEIVLWRDHSAVLFGGANDDLFFSDVWLYDFQVNAWKTIEFAVGYAPLPRRDHQACIVGDSLFVYGGKTSRSAYAGPELLRLSLAYCFGDDEKLLFTRRAIGDVFVFGFSGRESVWSPQRVLGGISQVKAAGGRMCAVEAKDGLLYEWGNTISAAPKLSPVASSERVLLASTGVFVTVAVLEQGVVWWTPSTGAKPVTPLQREKITAVASSSLDHFFLTQAGEILRWCHEQEGSVEVLKRPGDFRVSQMACGGDHLLCVGSNGLVYSYGSNSHYQLGRDAAGQSRELQMVPGLADICAVGAGASHSLAINSKGELFAWGRGETGELGIGRVVSKQQEPTRVNLDGEKAVRVAGGGGLGCGHSIALTADHGVFVWGSNKYGQLGTGTAGVVGADVLAPKRISVPGEAFDVACGWIHSAVLATVKEGGNPAGGAVVRAVGGNTLGMFSILPRDVRSLLVRMLGPVELSRMACCSSATKQWCDDEQVWKRLCDVRKCETIGRYASWKEAFLQIYGHQFVMEQHTSSGVMQSMRSFLGRLWGKTEKRVLMLGLDQSGKTTILYWLKLGEVVNVCGIGFCVETIEYKNAKLTIWEVNGQDKIRPMWRYYFPSTQALIYVIDRHDHARLEESAAVLRSLLAEPELQDIPLLIYTTKTVSETNWFLYISLFVLR